VRITPPQPQLLFLGTKALGLEQITENHNKRYRAIYQRFTNKKGGKKPPLCSPREHSMTCNSLIFKHGLENEQQINKQLFSITVL
jgi:hypothetical protein